MERWSSRLGFVLASIGAAVGIGNIWRFSSVVGQNGGGAYLVPYLIAVAAFGVPLMILEFAAGKTWRGTVVTAFASIHRRLRYAGWLIYTFVFAILSYYLVITGWVLAFLSFSLFARERTFAEFTSGLQPVAFFVIATGLTGAIVALGVKRGVEGVAKVAMPLAFLILAGLALYATTLSGYRDGIDFLFSPDFSVLREPSVWSAAVGQAFFSLSVGFGVLLAYASYLRDDANIVSSAWIIAIADVSAALLAGMVIFPIVFSFGLEPTLGAELAFTTLPTAFEQMPAGSLVAPAFFLLVFLAAITSAISMLEANVAAVTEVTGLGRPIVAVVLTLALMILGLPSALSYSSVDLRVEGTRLLDLMDDTLGTLGLPLGALLISVSCLWLYSGDVLREGIGGALGMRAVSLLRLLLTYLVPPVLMTLIVSRLLYRSGFEGWHLLPEAPLIGRLTRDSATLVLAVGLLMATLIVVAIMERLRRRMQRNAAHRNGHGGAEE